MSGNKEEKTKTVQLFHISHSLFRNKRLKRRRLASKIKNKAPKKRSKPPKSQKRIPVNGHPSTPNLAALFSETIEIVSTDDEQEQPTQTQILQADIESTPNRKRPEVETSIILSSDEEDESTTQARIFPMLTNQTTVQTEVGNSIFEISLTQLKEKLLPSLHHPSSKKRKKTQDSKRLGKRLNNSTSNVNSNSNSNSNNNSKNLSADLSISLLSDDDEEAGGREPQKDNNLDKVPSAMKV